MQDSPRILNLTLTAAQILCALGFFMINDTQMSFVQYVYKDLFVMFIGNFPRKPLQFDFVW